MGVAGRKVELVLEGVVRLVQARLGSSKLQMPHLPTGWVLRGKSEGWSMGKQRRCRLCVRTSARSLLHDQQATALRGGPAMLWP